MLIHSDTAPFSCQYCGRPNKCKNNNLKHEKRYEINFICYKLLTLKSIHFLSKV